MSLAIAPTAWGDAEWPGEPVPTRPGPGDPLAAARAFLAECHDRDGRPTLLHWRGEFLAWNGSCWRAVDDLALKASLYEFFEDATYYDQQAKTERAWCPNRVKVANLVDAVMAARHLAREVEEGSWLGSGTQWHAVQTNARGSEYIALEGGLLYIPTRTIRDATPDYFTRSHARVSVERALAWTACQRVPGSDLTPWEQFLNQLWPNDPDAIALLQEWFGYVLSGSTRQQKMLLIVGPPRSGKGTIGRVLQSLLGDGETAAPTLASMASNFGLSSLIGKSLAIVADARFGGQHGDVVVERLLSISGEDLQDVDRKHLPVWTGRLATRFMLMTNELPRLTDSSGALSSRFLILETNTSHLGREDLGLEERILADPAAILWWALDGLDRLREQGRFTEPESSREIAGEMSDLSSPIKAFIRDRCVLGPEHEVPASDIFDSWSKWCEEQGRTRPGTAQVFGRDLRAAAPSVRVSQPRVGASRIRVYQGIDCRCHCPNGGYGQHTDTCPQRDIREARP